MEAIAPHQGTLLVVHHANKAGANGSAAVASRGTSALPAAASQIIQLHRMAQSIPAAAPEKRIVLKTEGGAGAPLQLLIERTDQGWRLHGDAEAVMEAQRLLEAEAHLQDRKADALEAVRNQLEQDQQAMDAGTLANCLGIKGKRARDAVRKARSTLDQLSSRGLLVVEIHATGIGRRRRPLPAARTWAESWACSASSGARRAAWTGSGVHRPGRLRSKGARP